MDLERRTRVEMGKGRDVSEENETEKRDARARRGRAREEKESEPRYPSNSARAWNLSDARKESKNQ